MIHKVIRFFDKLEDHVRGALSHFPILYAFVGGIGIVLFWKGVWETAELFPSLFGPGSILLSVIILLMTGVFVSSFIGNEILISGLKSQKKIAEKTEEELKGEESDLGRLRRKVEKVEGDITEIKELLKKQYERKN
ncbi:hypothetical protein C4565_07410 [Candidatus Parcubacteria bacterium]|jgi:hypothetical protein|nr:MAG: hypothetical protein C4565_07410 [Candidatus Parcubacteria bacterium]